VNGRNRSLSALYCVTPDPGRAQRQGAVAVGSSPFAMRCA
jgi:hypothetical protein